MDVQGREMSAPTCGACSSANTGVDERVRLERLPAATKMRARHGAAARRAVDVEGRRARPARAGQRPGRCVRRRAADGLCDEPMQVLDYHEHAIGGGAKARAVAYLELRIGAAHAVRRGHRRQHRRRVVQGAAVAALARAQALASRAADQPSLADLRRQHHERQADHLRHHLARRRTIARRVDDQGREAAHRAPARAPARRRHRGRFRGVEQRRLRGREGHRRPHPGVAPSARWRAPTTATSRVPPRR